MYTLSVFPALLDYAQVAPFFLRLGLGIILGLMAHRSLRTKLGEAPLFSPVAFQAGTIVHFFELAAAALLIIGLFTQVAALAAIVFVGIRYKTAQKSVGFAATNAEKMLFALMAVVAASIMFFGAGFFAFDLPL